MHIAALVLSYLGAMLISMEVWKESTRGIELVSFLRLKNPSMLPPRPTSWRDLLTYRKRAEKLSQEIPLTEYLRAVVFSFVHGILVLLSVQIMILKFAMTLVELFIGWIQNKTEEIIQEMNQKDREKLNSEASLIGIKRIPVQPIFAVSMFTTAFILALVN